MLPPSLALALFIFAAITLLLGRLNAPLRFSLPYLEQVCSLVGGGVLLPWRQGLPSETKHFWHNNSNMLKHRMYSLFCQRFIINNLTIIRLVEGIPTSLQFQRFIFQGRFLDPRLGFSVLFLLRFAFLTRNSDRRLFMESFSLSEHLCLAHCKLSSQNWLC